MTAPDRGATYQIALASTASSTHDALCVTGTESLDMADHLPVAGKEQDVEVLNTGRRW